MKIAFGWISISLIMDTNILNLRLCRSLDGRWSEEGKLLPRFGRKTDTLESFLEDGVTVRHMTIKSWWMPYFFLRHGVNERDVKTIIVKDGDNYHIDITHDDRGWNLKSKDGPIAIGWTFDEVMVFVTKIKSKELVTVQNGKLVKS